MVAERVSWESVRKIGSRLTTPLHPDDYLSLVNPLWTSRELRGRIEKVIPETDDAATIVIRPGWGWSFDHKPGQYVGIGIQVRGQVPLALLLDLRAEEVRPHPGHHRAGHAGGLPLLPPRLRARAGRDHQAGRSER